MKRRRKRRGGGRGGRGGGERGRKGTQEKRVMEEKLGKVGKRKRKLHYRLPRTALPPAIVILTQPRPIHTSHTHIGALVFRDRGKRAEFTESAL